MAHLDTDLPIGLILDYTPYVMLNPTDIIQIHLLIDGLLPSLPFRRLRDLVNAFKTPRTDLIPHPLLPLRIR